MQNMTIEMIAKACNGSVFGSYDSTKEITGVIMDSRKAADGVLFIAVKGERVDGHRFIPQVFEQGAMCVVCETLPQELTGPCILVKDSLQALKDIGEFYRKSCKVKVVGITGSVGKTSTKEFVASVLSQKYKVHKTAGNFNNEIGLPLTVLGIQKEHEVAVLEMGINHFGEMHRLSKIARPDICVMTNIGQCHLEFLGTRDGILKAKSEIFDFMAEDGMVVLNGDDDKLSTLEQVKGRTPVAFGLQPDNAVYATDVENKGLFGSTAKIHIKNEAGTEEVIDVSIPLPGAHMVYNALCAAAVGRQLSLSAEEIRKGIETVQPTSGRSNIIRKQEMVIIDDCYNANPVSMEAAIDLLTMAEGRKVAILGDMFELGENELSMHRRVGAYAAKKQIDVLICIGTASESMYMGAKETENGSTEIYYYKTLQDFLNDMNRLLFAGDTVLVKASHSMGFEEVLKKL